MQLFGVLVSQLGRVDLLLCRVDGSLSLSYLGLESLVVDDEQRLSGTDRLTFLDINLCQES